MFFVKLSVAGRRVLASESRVIRIAEKVAGAGSGKGGSVSCVGEIQL